MINVSGFGLTANLIALETFPMGLNLQYFSDDTDALSIQDEEVAGYKMLYDGTLFSFTKAAPIIIRMGIIPGSEDDTNLKILLSARKSEGKLLPITDILTLVINYPEAGKAIFSNGTILSGPSADSITQDKRKRTNTYTFAFGSNFGAQTTTEGIANIISGVAGLF